MKRINFNKSYQLFWGNIPLIWLAVSLLPAEAIDIQVHDTYWVIAYYHLAIPITILLAGIGLLYWLFRKKQLVQWMTIFHTLITMLPILVLFIGYGFPSEDGVGDYIEGDAIGRSLFYLSLLLSFILGQILFVLNLLIALFKKQSDCPN